MKAVKEIEIARKLTLHFTLLIILQTRLPQLLGEATEVDLVRSTKKH